MSAKLLNVFGEENTELEKQIGCMTGIFQMFDRRHRLVARKLTGNSHKNLSLGRAPSSSSNQKEEYKPSLPQIILEYIPTKNSAEDRRASPESSKTVRGDFRGIVKDSINGEARGLSVKTSSREDARKGSKLTYRDSPRPPLPAEFNPSQRVLARLKDAPRNLSEVPRFSCDGREISRTKPTKIRELPRLSLDSRTKELDRSPSQRVPSVIAKLMGLEALPSADSQEPAMLTQNRLHAARSSLRPIGKPGIKQTETVYSQIERRVKDLEFQEKDLRALKHILGTMQAKGMLETKKGNDQLAKVATPTAFESPIVIMKPAKSVTGPEELEGLSGLRKVRTSGPTSRKQAKGEEISSQNTLTPLMQRSPRPQRAAREQSASPVKSSSPRVQRRKTDLEKKPRPLAQRQSSATRQQAETMSPRGENGLKTNRARKKNDWQDKQVCEIAHREDGGIDSAASVDVDARGNDCSARKKPLRIVAKEEGPIMDNAIIASEQPSPISVLDASFYHDESSPSPVKRISAARKDDDMQKYTEDSKNPMSPEIDSWELGNIKSLVQTLKQLISSTDDENDDDESQEQVLDYVLEILLSTDVQGETNHPKRLQHKLALDMVQDILVKKLESINRGPRLDIFTRARKFGGQFLLRELCSEVKSLLAEKPRVSSSGDHEAMTVEDLLPRSEGWEDFRPEVPGVVVEIERLIFKDLIDEVVAGEGSTKLLGKATTTKRCRQLFA